MSENGKVTPEIANETMSEVTPETSNSSDTIDRNQVQELHDYAVKALEALRQQEQDIAIQIERQVGMVSGLEMLLTNKAESTLNQIREAIKKNQEKRQ